MIKRLLFGGLGEGLAATVTAIAIALVVWELLSL